MRQALLALTVILGVSTTAAAQSGLRVDITDGQLGSGMSTVNEPYATGAPWASLPARPLKPGVEPTASRFRIRSWVEGDGVRVLVFAVTGAGSAAGQGVDNEREVQIASVFVSVDERVEIAATEKYNARRITISAEKMRAYLPRVQHGIDIPLRPWTPLPRR